MNKNRRMVFLLICVLCGFCSLFLLFMNSKGTYSTAFVYVDNELYMTIDLTDKIYRKYTVSSDYGYNIIEVSEGAVRVSESDCPDKTCVRTGFTDSSAKPVICMPHRLQILINNNNTDGIVE